MKIEGGSKQFPAGRYNNPSSRHVTNTLIILEGLIIQKRRGEFFFTLSSFHRHDNTQLLAKFVALSNKKWL